MAGLGKLFVFDGLEGAGKTTLAQAFVAHLRKAGFACQYVAFHEDDPGTLGKLVHDCNRDPHSFGINSLNVHSLHLLYVVAHIDLIETKIIPALKSGTSIVLDGFWWSTWVKGVVSKCNNESLRTMIKLENLHWGEVRPDCAFLVRRKQKSGETVNLWQKKLLEEYGKVVTRETRYYPIKCIDNDDTISAALSEIIRQVDLRRQLRRVVKVSRAASQFQLPFSQTVRPPLVFSKLSPAKPTIVYDTYWRFAAERQALFFRRFFGDFPPWTEDPILQEYKFTNAYRASDRVSQYLIRKVIYAGDQSPQEVFFRTLLFKIFNRIETWELLTRHLGAVSFADYSFKRYDTILTKAIETGERIYSAAYIMPSGNGISGHDRKHRMHLELVEKMMRDDLPSRLTEVPSMRQAFDLLRAYPTIGDFLAYQYVTDINYSKLTTFSEMEFVVPGPGALSGIRKCFSDLGGLSETEIIKVITDRQELETARLGLNFQSLWGRPLQLIDCQNLFCEVDKYARIRHPEFVGVQGRMRIKQKYRLNSEQISYWYPPKWEINDHISPREAHV